MPTERDLLELPGAHLSREDAMEELSVAYLHALCARAGLGFDHPSKDRDSVDVVVTAKGKLDSTSILSSPRIELQLKAAAGCAEGNTFPFDLPVKNYNDLRGSTALPRLLIVFEMPSERREWLSEGNSQLETRKCLYWHSLHGKPATENTTTVRIQIARQQRVTCNELRMFLLKASKGEPISNAH